MNNWSVQDQLEFQEIIKETFIDCLGDKCTETKLPNQPELLSKLCNKYQFYKLSLLTKPDDCYQNEKQPDCIVINQVYENTDPTEFANFCMRFIELKSKSDIYPPTAIIEKFENCWKVIYEILGNSQIFHLEKPILVIDGQYDRKRDLIRLLSRKQLHLKNGHEFPVLVLKWEDDPTVVDEHARLRG